MSVQATGMSGEMWLLPYSLKKLCVDSLMLSWDEGGKERKSFPEQDSTVWPEAENRRMINTAVSQLIQKQQRFGRKKPNMTDNS